MLVFAGDPSHKETAATCSAGRASMMYSPVIVPDPARAQD
jgi:hypothetical protein